MALCLAGCTGPQKEYSLSSNISISNADTLAGTCQFNSIFTDITPSTNIKFKHFTGAFTQTDASLSRYMPESIGSGVAIFDYDNDGDQDILAMNSTVFPGGEPAGVITVPRLFRNDGNLVFEDVTEQALPNNPIYGMGVTAADYNSDGYVDLLFTAWGNVRLLSNTGNGQFKDVTEEVGLFSESRQSPVNKLTTEWSTAAVFFDADGDQDLDLFVSHYVRWSPDTDVFITLDFKQKAYSSPRSYAGNTPQLYLQEQGQFVEHTQEAGIFQPTGKALGVALWDFDNDGRLDIVVANDAMRNFAYHNLGGGRFEEQAMELGLAYDENGRARAGMGIDIADYANNGDMAVAIGNFSKEPTSFFISKNGQHFRESSQQVGVASATYHALTFGLLFADLDLDGWLDLVMANGHVQPGIEQVYADESYRQAAIILKNDSGKGFTDVSKCSGDAILKPIVGRGLAAGDLDGDGDLDLVFSENAGSIRVLRNDINGSNYIRIHLKGDSPNTQAIGARLEVKSNDIVQRRIVRTGSSYLSQSELVQTFGLGHASRVEYVRVIWPNGDVKEIINPPINQQLTLSQASAGRY